MSVRYLDFDIVNSPVRVKTSLLNNGLACEVTTGRATTWVARSSSIVDHMMKLFDLDRWVMLEKPPVFRPGILPMDGVTGELKTENKP